jgi:hypothetical protein
MTMMDHVPGPLKGLLRSARDLCLDVAEVRLSHSQGTVAIVFPSGAVDWTSLFALMEGAPAATVLGQARRIACGMIARMDSGGNADSKSGGSGGAAAAAAEPPLPLPFEAHVLTLPVPSAIAPQHVHARVTGALGVRTAAVAAPPAPVPAPAPVLPSTSPSPVPPLMIAISSDSSPIISTSLAAPPPPPLPLLTVRTSTRVWTRASTLPPIDVDLGLTQTAADVRTTQHSTAQHRTRAAPRAALPQPCCCGVMCRYPVCRRLRCRWPVG